MDILNSGKDIHSEVGSMMFKKTITKENEEERYIAKTVGFMVPYGCAAPKLGDEMEISEEEAAKLLDLHAEAFPQLHEWLKKRGIYAKKYEHSVTIGPIRRKRFYPDMAIAKELRKKGVKYGDKETWKKILIIEGQTQRNGGNSPIQGGAADMSKEALIAIRNLILEYNNTYGEDTAFLTGFVHDSIEAEAKNAIAKQFAAEKNQIMVDVANKYLNGVHMKVDTSVTKKWGK
jgi:DNA polymerase I-like protein with 3'-5' exonuclease and polymerase domains